MSSYSRVFIFISVLYILTFFSPVFSQNCVLVGEKFKVTFNYNPPKTSVFWLKNDAIFFPAAVESSGSGCKPGGNAQAGFTFYCEDGGATYIMEIASKLSDKDANFTTDPIAGSFVYTPIVDGTGNDTNLNQCPKRLCDCNQPEEKVENNSTFSCVLTCTQYDNLILQYQPESGPVQDLENSVNATKMKCNPYTDLENSTFDYIVDSNHAVLGQFNSATNKVRLIVKMVTGGGSETVFETSYFYFASSGSSSGGGCDWCIPVLVPILVIVFVVFCGCCIYFVICKKKKKENKGEKKSDRQDEATELKDPKIQQTEGEIEKQENR